MKPSKSSRSETSTKRDEEEGACRGGSSKRRQGTSSGQTPCHARARDRSLIVTSDVGAAQGQEHDVSPDERGHLDLVDLPEMIEEKVCREPGTLFARLPGTGVHVEEVDPCRQRQCGAASSHKLPVARETVSCQRGDCPRRRASRLPEQYQRGGWHRSMQDRSRLDAR
jgi:hypothetical protein